MRRIVSISAALTVAATVAVAQPPVAQGEPRNAQQVLARYKQLSIQAEKSAEAMNQAQVEYDTQRKTVAQQKKLAGAAQARLAKADKQMAASQTKVDALARASARGAKVNRLYAMLVSDSPQNLLDNMTDLEMVSRQAAADLRTIRTSATEATKAKNAAEKSAATAASAVKDAERKRAELQNKQSKLQLEAVSIRAIYKSMTGQELAALRGPKYNFDPKSVPKGTAPALVAVQAALTRIGDPYVWGATGPDQFDCSGLMVWAYKQAGKTLPRTSQAQLGGGTPVARDDLKPGDLIIYYPDAHHVGMYVGDGYVVHASTFGVPVAVVPIDKGGPFNSARRY
ncbi:NlpC/P60 family protein [Gordonia hirsuta DSM 44140 = NBRC 16056]|uniref:NlpC/P60 family protein n=2 Tax=Gordonia hirsuta TaxID=53427 RepID=L7L740_9ACTN|nr:C40 family peptidase [Gordonia hirsuta]GAC55843.1 NlpC/P60 family protein [Gordonia hirsuta DSM 44140 = NBRC 16056]